MSESSEASILLVDDGELDSVAIALESEGRPFTRLRGGQIPNEIAPPRDLLIVTPRRVDRVRRGSPPDAAPGYPMRIIAVDEDSPAMRRRLRRAGLHLLVRLPTPPEIWRLLIARALYRGQERRDDPRVVVGSPVAMTEHDTTTLIDLSNRGCRLSTTHTVGPGDSVSFSIPAEHADPDTSDGPLELRGRVRRIVASNADGDENPTRTIAVVFDEDLTEATRQRLTNVIHRWSSGPHALAGELPTGVPPIPACHIPTLPGLMLDDETDPPVRGQAAVAVDLEAQPRRASQADEDERRASGRGQYDASIVAESETGPIVLIGRDLSAGGMRVERVGELKIGQTFRIALHGPAPTEPFIVSAEVIRDDGDAGFGLAFRDLAPEVAVEIEKMVACLPEVESLEEGEIGGLGAILSEILPGE